MNTKINILLRLNRFQCNGNLFVHFGIWIRKYRGKVRMFQKTVYILLAAPPRVRKNNFTWKKKLKSLGAAESRTRIIEFVVLSANHLTILSFLDEKMAGTIAGINALWLVAVSYAWWRGEQYVYCFLEHPHFPPTTHPGDLTLKNPSKSCDKPLRPNPTGWRYHLSFTMPFFFMRWYRTILLSSRIAGSCFLVSGAITVEVKPAATSDSPGGIVSLVSYFKRYNEKNSSNTS